jgi:cobalt-precorrin-6B (C15)-methyltransferase
MKPSGQPSVKLSGNPPGKIPGTSTQPENIAIAMGKLSIDQGMVFLDLGCGSGAVSLAASRYTDKIYGIDSRPQAVEASKALIPVGNFFLGDASEILPEMPKIDRCFIGGTRGIERFFPILMEKARPGCVVAADLARIGAASLVTGLMKERGIFEEIIQVQISRGYDLAGDIALRPVNPIFMVVGRC